MKQYGVSRTLDWLEIILRGIIQFLVQELCKVLLLKLKGRWPHSSLTKQALTSLGIGYIVWTLFLFLGWIGFTATDLNRGAFGNILGILTYFITCWGFILGVGFPGLILNRLVRRFGPTHWVVRMTDSFSKERKLEPRRVFMRKYPPYIQSHPSIAGRKL